MSPAQARRRDDLFHLLNGADTGEATVLVSAWWEPDGTPDRLEVKVADAEVRENGHAIEVGRLPLAVQDSLWDAAAEERDRHDTPADLRRWALALGAGVSGQLPVIVLAEAVR